jgi:hypothetical protein
MSNRGIEPAPKKIAMKDGWKENEIPGGGSKGKPSLPPIKKPKPNKFTV